MSDKSYKELSHKKLQQDVRRKERRKMRALGRKDQSIYFGLGMFGLVGWSVAVPTVIGVLLGAWIDKIFPGRYSWTLTLLIVGIVLGCYNAWYWINRHRKDMEKEHEEDRVE